MTSKPGCVAVTGAGQGNGRAIALGLAREGWSVAVIDVDAATAAQTAADIRAAGHRAAHFVCDVSDETACGALADAVGKELGDIGALVNNAGIVRRSGLDHDDVVGLFDLTFAINVRGMLLVSRAFLPALKRTKGAIVNLASIASFIATPNNVPYNASKGAVGQFTKSLALDLAASGIRCNAIAPGVIETRMTADTRADADKLNAFLRRIPMRRVGQPEELVGAVSYLISDAASYVTGAILPIDGGMLAN